MVNEDKANIYRQIPDINKSLVFLYHQCKTYYSFIVSLFLKSFCFVWLRWVWWWRSGSPLGVHGLSSFRARAQWLCYLPFSCSRVRGTTVSQPGTELTCLALQGAFLATGPQGKSPRSYMLKSDLTNSLSQPTPDNRARL